MVDANGHRIVFQLRYFPEGFSAKQADRRKQIKRSLTSALKHKPDEWVLAWPSVPHTSDYDLISDLRTDNPGLTIRPWDRTERDALLVEFPYVINVMRRGGAAIELLNQLRKEVAALAAQWPTWRNASPGLWTAGAFHPFLAPKRGVSNRQQVAERLRNEEQASTTIASLDGITFRLFMPTRLRSPNEPLTQVAWACATTPKSCPRSQAWSVARLPHLGQRSHVIEN